MSVTAFIPTKDRYNTTLPLAIMSVINQTVKVKKLLIMDDGEKKDLREIPTYSYIFKLLERKGIEWEVAFGNGCGIAHSHQFSVNKCDTEWLWRIDDDCVAEPDVLEKLLKSSEDPKVGAVGGLVLDPKHPKYHSLASNKIEDIYLGLNEQWYEDNNKEIKEVDHLYSSFIYRKEAASHGYNLELSKVAHTEETLFTHGMKRNGWKLILNPAAQTWHFRNPEGGIRAFKDSSLWEHDSKIFAKKLQEWGVVSNKYKFFVLDVGLGDSIVFSKLIPELKEKYKEYELIFAVCYPEVFKGFGIKQISIGEAQSMLNNISEYNIYKKMIDWKWEGSLESAYRKLYDL